MVRYGFPFMKIQTSVNHRIAGATLQQLEIYLVTMPPRWANVREGHVVRPTTLPHLHKPSGLSTWVLFYHVAHISMRRGSEHHGQKGGPRETPRTCGAIGHPSVGKGLGH